MREAVFDADARALAQAFWPGPLTLVAPAAPQCRVALLARAGLDSVALRAPSHPVARALIAAAGVPLVAPFGEPFRPCQPDARRPCAGRSRRAHRSHSRRRADQPRRSNRRSSPASAAAPRLLRHGAIPQEAIEAVLGRALGEHERAPGAAPLAPGLLASHYAPRAGLRLEATRGGAVRGGAGLRRRPQRKRGGDAARSVAQRRPCRGRGQSVRPSARCSTRRALSMIAVAPIPATGFGAAINDRLRRAAAPRTLESWRRKEHAAPPCKFASGSAISRSSLRLLQKIQSGNECAFELG